MRYTIVQIISGHQNNSVIVSDALKVPMATAEFSLQSYKV